VQLLKNGGPFGTVDCERLFDLLDGYRVCWGTLAVCWGLSLFAGEGARPVEGAHWLRPELHLPHAATRFDGSSLPPAARRVTWSTVVAGPPHQWQLNPSRRRISSRNARQRLP
jgi:hypothetical protein